MMNQAQPSSEQLAKMRLDQLTGAVAQLYNHTLPNFDRSILQALIVGTAMKELLVEKGVFTQEEFDMASKKVIERMEEAQAKAEEEQKRKMEEEANKPRIITPDELAKLGEVN